MKKSFRFFQKFYNFEKHDSLKRLLIKIIRDSQITTLYPHIYYIVIYDYIE